MVDEEKLQKWLGLSTTLKRIKVEEMKLRKEICADVLIGLKLPSKKRVMIGDEEVEVNNGVSHNLDDAFINQIWKELNEEEKSSLKFTPTLKLRPYKKLPKESILHEAVTVKPSAPTITILEPK